jgi:hypothetical protein
MTITLHLKRENFLTDLKTLKTIFQAVLPELIHHLRSFLKPLTISSSEFTKGNISIQVTPEEFELIISFDED